MAVYDFDKKRFEAFFDAIMAIILTILVLEFKVPYAEGATNLSIKHKVIELLPSFISYIVSFLLIVGLWIDHHLLFRNISHVTKPYIIINFLFILTLSPLPFATALAGENANLSFAVSILCINYFLMNVSFAYTYFYAMKKKMVDQSFMNDNKKTAIFSYIGIISVFLSIPLAYVNTAISFSICILVSFLHLMKRVKS